jgi:hypothetical protein
MRAWNGEQVSDLSNEIGPLEVKYLKLVDEMFDDLKIYGMIGDLNFLSMEEIRQAKEDRSRLTGEDGSSITYKVSGDISQIQIDVFHTDPESRLDLFVGNDPENMREFKADTKSYLPNHNDYGIFDPVRYTSGEFQPGDRYLKIMFTCKPQISSIEITHSNLR